MDNTWINTKIAFDEGAGTHGKQDSVVRLDDALLQYPQACTFSPTFDDYYASFHPHCSTSVVEISGVDSEGRFLLCRTRSTHDSNDTSQPIDAHPAVVITRTLDRQKTEEFHVSSLPKTLSSIRRLFNLIAPREVLIVGELGITSPLEMYLARRGSSVNLELINVLDLSKVPTDVLLTKSVKQASAVHEREGLAFYVTDTSTEDSVTSLRVNAFRQLHAQVAGRATRPTETWMEQEKLIRQGSAVMVSAVREERLLGASLFFISGSAAYYASSASDRDHLEFRIGHGLVRCGIETLAHRGINHLVMGSINSSKQLTTKEEGIHRFKSLFRGNLVQWRSYGIE